MENKKQSNKETRYQDQVWLADDLLSAMSMFPTFGIADRCSLEAMGVDELTVLVTKILPPEVVESMTQKQVEDYTRLVKTSTIPEHNLKIVFEAIKLLNTHQDQMEDSPTILDETEVENDESLTKFDSKEDWKINSEVTMIKVLKPVLVDSEEK